MTGIFQFMALLFGMQTLGLRAAAAMQAKCSSDSCIPLNVSTNSLCTLNPAACTADGSERHECTTKQVNTVSSLVMMASPECNPSVDYDIWTLWDAADSNYKLVIRESQRDSWHSESFCVDRSQNTATFKDHHVQGILTQIQVKTKDIHKQNYSVYDVRVQALLPRERRELTTYGVYNDSSGGSCEQLYTPLSADKVRATASWESEGEPVQVDVQWCNEDTRNLHGYIVAIGSGNCTSPGRNPPCFIVQNSSGVSIGPLSWQTDIRVQVYRVITTYCSNPATGDQLVHLFQGCGALKCCANYGVTVRIPTYSAPSTASGATGPGIFTTTSSQTPPCSTSSRTWDPVSSTDDKSSSYSTNTTSFSTDLQQEEAGPSWWIPVVAICVSIVIIVVVISILITSMAIKQRMLQSSSNISIKLNLQPLSDSSTVHISGHSSHGESSPVSTPTSVESSEPLLHDPCSTKYTALIVYSPNTPKKQQDWICCDFIPKLQSEGIKTLSHDFACIKESPSLWLEREISKATAVLCVCNREFKEDWEGCKPTSPTSLPLVQSLKHLILATVHQGGDLSKYAVVLLDSHDQQYIPTKYLQSDSRQFGLTEVETIARFVCSVPTHRLDNEQSPSLGQDRKQYACTCV